MESLNARIAAMVPKYPAFPEIPSRTAHPRTSNERRILRVRTDKEKKDQVAKTSRPQSACKADRQQALII